MIRSLIADPIGGFLILLEMIPGLFLGMALHEFAHAFAAVRMGDDTPKRMGRLTLNPLAHIDWAGFAMFLLLGFGWAKPVMTNAAYYNDVRKGKIVVSCAGIAANLLLCVLFGFLYFAFAFVPGQAGGVLCDVMYYGLSMNATMAVLNFLPISPLDGSKLFGALFPNKLGFLMDLDRYGMMLLLILSLTGILDGIIGFFTRGIIYVCLLIWSMIL